MAPVVENLIKGELRYPVYFQRVSYFSSRWPVSDWQVGEQVWLTRGAGQNISTGIMRFMPQGKVEGVNGTR